MQSFYALYYVVSLPVLILKCSLVRKTIRQISLYPEMNIHVRLPVPPKGTTVNSQKIYFSRDFKRSVNKYRSENLHGGSVRVL